MKLCYPATSGRCPKLSWKPWLNGGELRAGCSDVAQCEVVAMGNQLYPDLFQRPSYRLVSAFVEQVYPGHSCGKTWIWLFLDDFGHRRTSGKRPSYDI